MCNALSDRWCVRRWYPVGSADCGLSPRQLVEPRYMTTIQSTRKNEVRKSEKFLTTTGTFRFLNNSTGILSSSVPAKMLTTSSENSTNPIFPYILANSCLWATAEPCRTIPHMEILDYIEMARSVQQKKNHQQ
jgi:hypothetical protein